jgi:hypothetical protein
LATLRTLTANPRLRRLLWRRGVYPAVQNARALSWRVPFLSEATLPHELAMLRRHPRRYREARSATPRVLFFSPRGWSTTLYEALIAAGLRARGADARFVTCGGDLPICSFGSIEVSPPPACGYCRKYGDTTLQAFGFAHTDLRDLWRQANLPHTDLFSHLLPEQLPQAVYKGVPLGQLVRPAVAGYLRADRLTHDAAGIAAYRRFIAASVPIVDACEAALDRFKPERIFMASGLFFPDALMLHLARKRDIDVLTYEFGHRPSTLVFAWNGPAGLDFDLAWARYKDTPLSPAEQVRIEGYLRQRAIGSPATGDIAVYWPEMVSSRDSIRDELGLNPDWPIVTLFTNILWDTALYERDVAFGSFRHWLSETIRVFERLPEVQLVIRVHPAEVRLALSATRDTVVRFLVDEFPRLPPNVFVVPPESSISSYTLGALSAVSLVYASTIGLELAAVGKTVLVGGAVHYGRKGFTADITNGASYEALLRDALREVPMPREHVELALRYAHFFFYRASLPFPLVEKSMAGDVRLDPSFADRLGANQDPGLQAVCDALLTGSEVGLSIPDSRSTAFSTRD